MIDIVRKFKTSDSGLDAMVQRVLVGANRDVAELTPFGFDQARIDALSAMRIGFVDLPTDIELSSMMMDATEAKKAKRTEATNYVMLEIMQRAEMRFGKDHSKYRRFGTSGIHNMTDAEFHATLRRVVRCANALQGEMVAQGLTPAVIAALETLRDEFVALWDAQAQAIEDRDDAVTTRVTAGNTLYAETVLLADLGKRKWLNVEASKYNDYVLYPNQGGAEEEPENEQQVVESPVAPGAVVNLSVTALEGTETMTVENLGPIQLQVYFSPLPTDPPQLGIGFLAPGDTATLPIAEAGYVAGVQEYLNVYNPGASPGQVKVTVTD